MLIEVLVALGLALLFLVVLTRGFETAWSRARVPAETAWALALAKEVAAQFRDGTSSDAGTAGDFQYATELDTITIEKLDSTLPHAPPAITAQGDDSSQKPLQGDLKAITINVTGPSGRVYEYESIKLDFPQN